MPGEEQISGSIFILLEKFIESTYGKNTWAKLNKATGTKSYDSKKNYPMSAMQALLSGASKATGISANDLKEKFGEFLVPGLLNSYQQYVNPTWKTYEMLLYTEKIMHTAVRKENEKANPPALHISNIGENLLIIDYYSKRKMAALAVGIIKGIADYYDESEKVEVDPVTGLDDERVQIRVIFK